MGVKVIPPATGGLQPADGAIATCMRDRTRSESSLLDSLEVQVSFETSVHVCVMCQRECV